MPAPHRDKATAGGTARDRSGEGTGLSSVAGGGVGGGATCIAARQAGVQTPDVAMCLLTPQPCETPAPLLTAVWVQLLLAARLLAGGGGRGAPRHGCSTATSETTYPAQGAGLCPAGPGETDTEQDDKHV